MRILFYIGYQSVKLDPSINVGGGTEIALVNIANEMVKFGYDVIISGHVKNVGKTNGVTWMHTDLIHDNYKQDDIDVIVSASYIHFALEFEKYNAKKVFWVHNTHHHSWFNGEELLNADELTRSVDHTVCLTDWHKNMWQSKYSVDPNKITIIGNGIEPNSFIGNPNKIKGKFIWSSEPSRGLFDLLKQWHKIKQTLPHASLDIYSPKYGLDQLSELKHVVDILDDVNIIGNKNQLELHDAMLKAEYWCYMTNYEETYCITALEMQYANVIPITTECAALKETVHSGVISKHNSETNWDNAILSIGKAGYEIKQKVIDSNYNWAKRQTWDQRSYDWKELIQKITS